MPKYSLETLAQLWVDAAARLGFLSEDPVLSNFAPGSEESAIAVLQCVYTTGNCGDFAVALHERTLWPVWHLNDRYGAVHSVCQAPEDRYVDVGGFGTIEEIRLRGGFRPLDATPAWGHTGLVGRMRPEDSPLIGISPMEAAHAALEVLPYEPFIRLRRNA